MDKATLTLMKEAERAFMQVESHYAHPSGLSTASLSPVHQIFHFIEERRWAYYLRYIAYFKVTNIAANKVEGVTHSYATTPKIGINSRYHTFATLIHESIHFFSHYDFRRIFSVDAYEGATEYLTRQLLGEPGPRRDMQGEGDIYAREYAFICSRISGDSDREQLRKAYFLGDEKAISHIRQSFIH